MLFVKDLLQDIDYQYSGFSVGIERFKKGAMIFVKKIAKISPSGIR
jgi:hypothetical protein